MRSRLTRPSSPRALPNPAPARPARPPVRPSARPPARPPSLVLRLEDFSFERQPMADELQIYTWCGGVCYCECGGATPARPRP